MARLTKQKLDQAAGLLARSDLDIWLTFVRETFGSGDPVLPLILEGGLTWESALIVARDAQKIAIVGNFDADSLAVSGDWDEVMPYVQGIREPLLSTLELLIPKNKPARIGVNFSKDNDKADGLSHGMYLLLQDHLKGTRFENSLVSAEDLVSRLRSLKTPEEIRRIKAAIAVTNELFDLIDKRARIGMTERELYELVQTEIDGRGLSYSWDRAGDPIVNFGPDSMIGHGIASDTIRLAPGQILHVDLGILKDGYASDIQSCWYVPKEGESAPPQDVLKAMAAVTGAISAGADALRPGVEGWKVDESARKFIVESGYPEYMHALGHQVGRVAHDGGALLGPRWERYGKSPIMKVEAGQVFTLELGAFVESRGYLGIEEMVQVTESGLEWLTDRQLKMPLILSKVQALAAD